MDSESEPLSYARSVSTPHARPGRPRVSSRELLEEVAFEFLLRDGYEATTVQALIDASGIGRTTFFRYFGSKAGIVWGEFDRAVDRLRTALDEALSLPVMHAIRIAVVASTRQSAAAAPDTWLDRFRVIDRDPALVAETAAHWRNWAAVISDHVAERTGLDPTGVTPAAIGGAVQASYVAVLRAWVAGARPTSPDVDDLDDALLPVCEALQQLLEDAAGRS